MSKKLKVAGKGVVVCAYTIPQFCKVHGGFSRTHYYALKREGCGPIEMKVGSRRLISFEAAAEWRKRMEQR